MKLISIDPDVHNEQSQNALYELLADLGEVYARALRRDSPFMRGIDIPENWLELSPQIAEARAKVLFEGANPTKAELQLLIQWQVTHALEQLDPDVIPTLWICHSHDSAECVVIESWGDTLETQLILKWIGRYSDINAAHHAIDTLYVTSKDNLEFES